MAGLLLFQYQFPVLGTGLKKAILVGVLNDNILFFR